MKIKARGRPKKLTAPIRESERFIFVVDGQGHQGWKMRSGTINHTQGSVKCNLKLESDGESKTQSTCCMRNTSANTT